MKKCINYIQTLKLCSRSTLSFSEKLTQITFIPNIETDFSQFLGIRVMR
jgi:hypothetical protein